MHALKHTLLHNLIYCKVLSNLPTLALIRVVKTDLFETNVNSIDLQLSVVAMEPKPSEKTRTIIDINMKEYVNHGKVAQDESIVQINKKSGDRYSFSTTKGINFRVGGHFGAHVMGAAVAGGSIGIRL